MVDPGFEGDDHDTGEAELGVEWNPSDENMRVGFFPT